MRNNNNILAFAALFIAAITYAQDNSPAPKSAPAPVIDYETTVFNSNELQVKPEYPGGINDFYKLISTNMKAPDFEPETDMVLKVYVSFVIEKDGSITDIKALRDPGYGMGAEAKRVLSLSKKWSPGKQNGKIVRSSFMLPIAINLEGTGTKEEAPVKE
jgi:protein TonB